MDCPLNMTEVDFPGYLLLRCSFWFKVDRGNQGEIYELTNSSIFDLTDDSTTEAQDTPISIGILVAGSKRDAAIFSPSRCILKRLRFHFGQDRKLVERVPRIFPGEEPGRTVRTVLLASSPGKIRGTRSTSFRSCPKWLGNLFKMHVHCTRALSESLGGSERPEDLGHENGPPPQPGDGGGEYGDRHIHTLDVCNFFSLLQPRKLRVHRHFSGVEAEFREEQETFEESSSGF